MRAVEAVKGVHSHTDRANEASRIYGDRNKFEFPLRRTSGATCEFIYAREGGRGGVTNPDERVEEEKEHGRSRRGRRAKRKGAKKARAKGRISLSDPPACLSFISVACTRGMY